MKTAASLSWEDVLLGKLESICSIFDNIYLLKSLGIISKENFLYRKLNKGNVGSKVWFLTLILSIRKNLKRLVRLVQTRFKLVFEIEQILRQKKLDDSLVNNVVLNKLSTNLRKCHFMIIDTFLDLAQLLIYLFIVSGDCFNIPPRFKKFKKYLGPMSNVVTILRMLVSVYTTIY
ncbi:Pex34p KNAG_0C00270 [Huiozyma naganishii CBS 8797]|uniref:Uncharacterized protein n=1 Tax=Huiozyma naganishii (strain ATCC MYA-139 / BCRC 22969 / CBS 8797 / KCTC 17520 / NBRC 10181 / NCYC 3082 / Yp74L-3) TaxID=1071383 RepID=J7R2U2_HUIN7|nr:hypothetical protein KNAG_0C00270 [Kazachstania naganishii CBS 8797]CCK69140.1 hypothetical protein KNAG_0C00270 [Kazachstania naganishii CBS 8797]